VPEQRSERFAAAARKRKMLSEILGARNYARGERRRQARLLSAVELRVLEGRESLDLIEEGRWEARLLDAETLGEQDSHLGRARFRGADGLWSSWRRNHPRLLGVHVVGPADLEADYLPAPRTLLRDRLDRSRVDRADARKELPLVGERNEPLVDEHRVSTLSRVVLKRQRDQVAEPAAGKRVLVREEPIVGLRGELMTTSQRLHDQ